MSKELHLWQPKLILAEFCIQSILPKDLQRNSQMSFMLFYRARIDQNIIDEDDDELIQIGPEHPIHQVHECRWGIRQPKGHHQKFEMPIPGSESSLGNVLLFYPELVVSRTKVYLRETARSSQLIEEIIYPW